MLIFCSEEYGRPVSPPPGLMHDALAHEMMAGQGGLGPAPVCLLQMLILL